MYKQLSGKDTETQTTQDWIQTKYALMQANSVS